MADYRDNAFPEDDATRGRFPMADGLLDYFPNALAAVAEVSKIGNDKHNPGQPMHHARGKSMDHRNKIMRHLCDAGGKDAGGVRHSAYVAWRALALLQEELEAQEGAPMARAAKPAEPVFPDTPRVPDWLARDTGVFRVVIPEPEEGERFEGWWRRLIDAIKKPWEQGDTRGV